MPTLSRVLTAAAIAAACTAAHAAPETVNLPGLPSVLEGQAKSMVPLLASVAQCGQPDPAPGEGPGRGPGPGPGSRGRGCKWTFTQLVSFGAAGFKLTAPPPLRYQLIPGYAYYAARCAPMAMTRPGQTGPTQIPRQQQLLPLLPHVPALPADTSVAMEVQKTIDLSLYAPTSPPSGRNAFPQPDALTLAWGGAAVQGRARLASSAPVLRDGPPPLLGSGVIVVAATPYYRLDDAAYQVFAAPAEMIVNGSTRVLIPFGEPVLGAVVVGQLSGGRWAQGSGLLFIPAPNAIAPTRCQDGAFVTPVDLSTLAARGIVPGQGFEMTTPGAVFTRTAGR